MKTLLLILLFTLNINVIFAQITLEKSYSYSVGFIEADEDEFIYFLMDVPMMQCRIFNSDHQQIKTINLSIPSGYYLSDIKYVTKHLFNQDDLIELLYVYEKYVTSANGNYYQYGMSVINENGNQLMTLNNGAFAEVKQLNKKNKLLAYTYLYNVVGYYDVTTNIYNLDGNADYISLIPIDGPMVFPNPSKDYINIELSPTIPINSGSFNLTTIQGQQILSTPVKQGQKLSIPTSDLSSGVYLWSLINDNKIISSNKIIVK